MHNKIGSSVLNISTRVIASKKSELRKMQNWRIRFWKRTFPSGLGNEPITRKIKELKIGIARVRGGKYGEVTITPDEKESKILIKSLKRVRNKADSGRQLTRHDYITLDTVFQL